MTKETSGSRTLLWSVLMSAPGPLVVGLGLLSGRSATQLADFFRRSSELLAIIMAFVTYRMTANSTDAARKARIERLSNAFVGAMMVIAGAFMIFLTCVEGMAHKGNVIPGLSIAVMGVIANTIFWRKYARLNRTHPNAILAVQARLYRAKSLVDMCVTVALTAVVIAPNAPESAWLDFIGSLIVATYLLFCGVKTVWEAARKRT